MESVCITVFGDLHLPATTAFRSIADHNRARLVISFVVYGGRRAGLGTGSSVRVVRLVAFHVACCISTSCRKNRPQGSKLTRQCWCRQCERTCPIHVVGRVVRELDDGTALFDGISASCALRKLHELLEEAGVANASLYRCHDIRRGHALDLQLSGATFPISFLWVVHAHGLIGAPLHVILSAGEWKSPAFLKYLDLHSLERDLVVQAHADDSDDDMLA